MEQTKQSISIEWIDMYGNKRKFLSETISTYGDEFLKKNINNFIKSVGLDGVLQLHNQDDCGGF